MNLKERDPYEDSSYDEILDFDSGRMEEDHEMTSVDPDDDPFYRSLDEY